jgi:hypothetical protein
MANEDATIQQAYDYLANWTQDRGKFEELLDRDVVWVETDGDLNPGWYQGRPGVMAHLDFVVQHLGFTTFNSANPIGQHWRVNDDMQVQGHAVHPCVTDVVFRDGLISRVNHCLGHAIPAPPQSTAP